MIVLHDSCNEEILQPLIMISKIVSPVVVMDPPPTPAPHFGPQKWSKYEGAI